MDMDMVKVMDMESGNGRGQEYSQRNLQGH
jgi:hypothetical protein